MLDGVITGIEDNWFQGRIADSAYEQERLFNQGRRTIVGVHGFTEGNDEAQMSLLQITNEDIAALLGAGVAAVLTPGATADEVVATMRRVLAQTETSQPAVHGT
jgi:methylmalonyl-CoA mutase N-terminal domain/subunit